MSEQNSTKSMTPLYGDIKPTYRLHMGQKLFSSAENNPNLPKPKTLYWVEFSINSAVNEFSSTLNLEQYNKLSQELSKLVKEYTKPSPSLKTITLNEYNRKRVVYDSIDYPAITITFFDVKENMVQEFFINYLKMINNDYMNKSKDIWKSPTYSGFLSTTNEAWQTSINKEYYSNGDINSNSFGLTMNSHFNLIDEITIYEYYQNKVFKYYIENPKITKVDFGSSKMGDFASNDIKVTFEYEGVIYDIENQSINDDIANKIQKNYKVK